MWMATIINVTQSRWRHIDEDVWSLMYKIRDKVPSGMLQTVVHTLFSEKVLRDDRTPICVECSLGEYTLYVERLSTVTSTVDDLRDRGFRGISQKAKGLK